MLYKGLECSLQIQSKIGKIKIQWHGLWQWSYGGIQYYQKYNANRIPWNCNRWDLIQDKKEDTMQWHSLHQYDRKQYNGTGQYWPVLYNVQHYKYTILLLDSLVCYLFCFTSQSASGIFFEICKKWWIWLKSKKSCMQGHKKFDFIIQWNHCTWTLSKYCLECVGNIVVI